jgi:hypothetical protein
MEDITAKALPQLKAGSDPNAMEDDWVTNFFDKARIVSDGDMQDLWSRVLAGEANAPGSYTRRTVNFLSDLDKSDAGAFSELCGFCWQVMGPGPLIFDYRDEIYKKEGVTFDSLSHLESIGLIQFTGVSTILETEIPKHIAVYYFGKPLFLEMPKDEENVLEIGYVRLTKTGMELAPIAGGKPVDGFWDYVCNQWKRYLPKPVTEQSAAPNADSASAPQAPAS